jgi:hypothetical protein
MIVNLFTFVELYERVLGTASHLLTKGAEFAKEREIPETDMLGWRLIDDMQPLAFQIMVVANFAGQWPARAAGLPIPAAVGADLTVAAFQEAIAESKAWLAEQTPQQFEGRDDVPPTYKIGEGMEPTMPIGQWIAVFATTTLYFHLSTAYGILRSKASR